MTTQDFTTTILVSQTPTEAFNAVNNVTGWWTANFEGNSEKLNDIFTVRFGGGTYITNKVVELTPGKKIVWDVVDCNKPWLKNTKEWAGTKIIFDIAEKEKKTQIRFTHLGLVPEVECYGVCSNAWNQYLQQSLFGFITTGKGKPDPKAKATKEADAVAAD